MATKKIKESLIIKDKNVHIDKNGSVHIFGCSKEEIRDITDHSPKAEFEITRHENKEQFRTTQIGNATFYT